MSSLKASGIIYQAQYFEENITTQISGQGQGVFAKTTHTTSSIQTTVDVVPLDTATKEILERNKRLLTKMSSENVRKSDKAIDYSVAYAKDDMFGLDSHQRIEESVEEKVDSEDSLESDVNDDIWGIDKYRQVEESANEDDLIFNFDREEDSDSKKFEDFSTLMGKEKLTLKPKLPVKLKRVY